jgi:hypothetical protein
MWKPLLPLNMRKTPKSAGATKGNGAKPILAQMEAKGNFGRKFPQAREDLSGLPWQAISLYKSIL